MNRNTGIKTINSHMPNNSNGAFFFHKPTQEVDYSDDSYQTVDEDDDDEYEPISLTAWGDSAKKEPASWDNLVDDSIKVKAGGVGTGNLHRRGGNYRPVSEDAILAQRLNKPIPGKKSGTSKSHGGKKKKSSKPPPFSKPSQFNRPPPFNKPPIQPTARAVAHVPPARRPSANAPPSPWGAIPLAETPFWENKPAVTNSITPARGAAPAPTRRMPTTAKPSSPTPVLCETPFWEVKKAPAPVTPEPTPSNWNVKAQGYQPVKEAPTVATVASFNPSAPSFEIKTKSLDFNPTVASFTPSISTSVSSSSASSKKTFNPNVNEFLPLIQLPVKTVVKIAPPSEPSVSKRDAPNPATMNQFDTTNKNPSVLDDLKNLSMESQTGPESTRGLEEPKPLIQITLELAPGISTEILIYENSDPYQLAEDFARKHQLNMTNTAKNTIAQAITLLLNAKKTSIAN